MLKQELDDKEWGKLDLRGRSKFVAMDSTSSADSVESTWPLKSVNNF